MESPAKYLSAPGHDPERIAAVFEMQRKAALKTFLESLLLDMTNPLPDGARRVGPRVIELLLADL